MMKRLLDRHEWAVDIAAAVLCASALAHATSAALDRRPTPAPPAMVIAQETGARQHDQWGIRKLGERSYEIEASGGAVVFDRMDGLSRAARIVPEITDGRATGFRLFSVRADGPLFALGFRNGDTLRSVNGLGLTSPEEALRVYAALRSSDHFTVQFERNGIRLTNEYRLR